MDRQWLDELIGRVDTHLDSPECNVNTPDGEFIRRLWLELTNMRNGFPRNHADGRPHLTLVK